MIRQGTKHLVECHCVLPQYRNSPDPTYHHFVVFSEIDERDEVVPKHVLCPNCGVLHRVFDLTKSEIVMGNESGVAVITVDDLKHSLPSHIVSILESYNVDLPTWEEASFIHLNQVYSRPLILTGEKTPDGMRGKCLRFAGGGNVRIEPYIHKSVV